MKKYTAPTVEITKFVTEDIITTSITDSGNPTGQINDAEIPQVIDTQNIFNYN